jgi:hypothetical protein
MYEFVISVEFVNLINFATVRTAKNGDIGSYVKLIFTFDYST